MMLNSKELRGFLDAEGRLIRFPARLNKQLVALDYLASKFEMERDYSEKEVNEILNRYHNFSDPALLRRELFIKMFLNRTDDGRRYWKERSESRPSDHVRQGE
jgi:hypothetical protein